jgi:hypothetical protein
MALSGQAIRPAECLHFGGWSQVVDATLPLLRTRWSGWQFSHFQSRHAFGGERMVDELLSLRVIVVSAAKGDRELLRHAAAAAKVPLEMLEAENAALILLGSGFLRTFDWFATQSVACERAKPQGRCEGRSPHSVFWSRLRRLRLRGFSSR